MNDAAATVRRLCDFAEIEWDEDLSHGTLPLARHTLTPPAPDKWKQNESVIRPLLAPLEPTINRIRKRRATSVSSPLHGAMAIRTCCGTRWPTSSWPTIRMIS